MLSMGIKLFDRIAREAFQGPMHGTLWSGKVVYSGGNLPQEFQFPIFLCPSMEKVQPCPQQGQNESSVLSFCFMLKLILLEPMPCAVGPSSC